ncbi:hypothetical protein GOODEAATRI_031144 [Goodea atripinnis]|uniref:Uncharacterized protein n=1 Tax=Goodea atripinnis TaxID=208336 RepID=A0ABV0NQQ0_9TELE
MIELGLADGSLIDELMELTAQSIGQLEIQEHFNIIKEIGRGKYGKVLLVTHRFRGTSSPPGIRSWWWRRPWYGRSWEPMVEKGWRRVGSQQKSGVFYAEGL